MPFKEITKHYSWHCFQFSLDSLNRTYGQTHCIMGYDIPHSMLCLHASCIRIFRYSMHCIQTVCVYILSNFEEPLLTHFSTCYKRYFSAHTHFRSNNFKSKNFSCTLTDSETLMDVSSSAFFSRELTHSLRFCLQREAAARFRSRKRCLLSSGSSSVVLRLRPPVGWAGDTWKQKGRVNRDVYCLMPQQSESCFVKKHDALLSNAPVQICVRTRLRLFHRHGSGLCPFSNCSAHFH